MMSACGQGGLTPLSDHRHQVAQLCGAAIAAKLGSHQPIVLSASTGGSAASTSALNTSAIDHFSLIVEPVRYGLASPQPVALPPGLVFRSARCLALRRDSRQPLSVYLPSTDNRPLLGAELGKELGAELGASPLTSGPITRQPLRPITTSLGDFRRCGFDDQKEGQGRRALVIWPHDGDPNQPPGFLTAPKLSFSLSGPRTAPRAVEPNSRGCLYHRPKLSGQRLHIRNHKGLLVATRPLRITRQGALPLILCPRGPQGELQMAVPEAGAYADVDAMCRPGFLSYCELALAGRLRPELGDWLGQLAEEAGTADCRVVAARLKDGSLSRLVSPVAADLEALRYLSPTSAVAALTVEAEQGLAYLPRLPGLRELTVYHDQPAALAYAFAERQPQLRDLNLTGAAVDLTALPLGQLASLTLRSAKLSSLTKLQRAQNLRYLDLGYNAITDIAPLIALPKLASLGLEGNPLRDITPLERLAALRAVDVSGLRALDVGVLSRLTALTGLQMRSTGLRHLAWLPALAKLSRLDIGSNAITDLTPLAQLSALSRLNARRNGIVDLRPLAGLGRLQVLSLEDNEVRSIMALKELALLRAFELRGNPLGTTQKKSTDNCPVDAKAKVIREFCTR